jgi:hypothetical protein
MVHFVGLYFMISQLLNLNYVYFSHVSIYRYMTHTSHHNLMVLMTLVKIKNYEVP